MKKILTFAIFIIFGVLGCSSKTNDFSQADYSDIPSGYVDKVEHYDSSGFRDYTDYAKYIYSSEESIANNENFQLVNSYDIAKINDYVDNFSNWMMLENRIEDFDFDNNIINEGDYFYIKSNIKDDNNLNFENYSVYYFDIESLTLYYLHNNT